MTTPQEALKAEAKKLIPILRELVEGGGEERHVDIYADDYQAGDGDVFVTRAADLLADFAALDSEQPEPPKLCNFGNEEDFDEALEDFERQKRYAEVGAMEYNGNTVGYMYLKAKNYGNVLIECCQLLGGSGDVRTRIKALLAERDALLLASAVPAPVAQQKD